MRVTCSRQSREVSSTFALSTEVTFPRRPAAARKPHSASALDLGERVDAGVEGAVGLAPALAEVEAAGELAHHQQVGALDALAAQRAGVVERRPRAHRAQVGVEAEARAQAEQPLLGARLGRGRWCPTSARRPRRAAPRPTPAQAASTSSVRAVPWASIEAPPTRCSCHATARPCVGGDRVHQLAGDRHHLRPDPVARQQGDR